MYTGLVWALNADNTNDVRNNASDFDGNSMLTISETCVTAPMIRQIAHQKIVGEGNPWNRYVPYEQSYSQSNFR